MSNSHSKRYRMYCVHKHLIFCMFELERKIAKMNFCDAIQFNNLKLEFTNFEFMMKMHAEFEEKMIHPLLKERGSQLFDKIELDHANHHAQFEQLHQQLDQILIHENESNRLSLGHKFYLSYRLLISEVLHHLNQEETLIVDELHRLYSNDELKEIEHVGYQKMSLERMVHMTKVQFSNMDTHDKTYILSNLKEADPEKYEIISQSGNISV